MRQRSLKALTTIGLLALPMLASEARQLPEAAQSSAAVTQLLEEASALRAKGERSSLQQSLAKLEQAIALSNAAGDRAGEANARNILGATRLVLGDATQALEAYTRALEIARSINAPAAEAAALNGIGRVRDSWGHYDEALAAYTRVLAIARASADRRTEATAIGNLGRLLQAGGESQRALDHFREALQAFEALGDGARQATALHAIGAVYHTLGDSRRAIGFYEQALKLLRAQGNRLAMAPTLNTLGLARSQTGDYQGALDALAEALAIATQAEDTRLIAYAIHNQGDVARAMGNYGLALDYQRRALPLRQAVNDRAGETRVLVEIGMNLTALGDYAEGRRALGDALSLADALQDRAGQILAHSGLARVERASGNLNAARDHLEAALGGVESLRSAVAGHELRTSYFAASHAQYELYIELLMAQHRMQPSGGFDRLALEASERSRARSLIDLLTEARVDIRQGLEPALLERERVLRSRLNARADRQMRLMSDASNGQEAAAITAEIEQLTTTLREVEAQIRVRSPQYAALSAPQPLSAQDVQRLLDKDTLLIEYALGDERSYMWAVTSESVTSFELPRRSEIERLARQVHQQLATRTQQGEAIAALSDMVLGPIRDRLQHQRLLIVTDGALQYIPFAALSSSAARDPLIANHEIVNVPSASTLSALRLETTQRRVGAKAVAVVADPVFDIQDERVKGPKAAAASAAISNDSRLSAESVGLVGPGGHIARLPFTRREARNILALVPPAERFEAVDFRANRTTVTGDALRPFRIVHFATHGFLNNDYPELSGIVLSLVDERGQPQDGFLRLHDLYNLRLPAELVTLSACQTALGEETRGEGIVGLTRGLMYAGAARVLASLWKVDDAATAELMKRFYAGMLGPQRLSPAAALRAAQVSMREQRRWNAPYYWAAFILQGEWR
jgi:CHAT domain-containing protein/tetratricopeptide (TPR) repeat protein